MTNLRTNVIVLEGKCWIGIQLFKLIPSIFFNFIVEEVGVSGGLSFQRIIFYGFKNWQFTQGDRGLLAVYYTSPQSFIITAFYILLNLLFFKLSVQIFQPLL